MAALVRLHEGGRALEYAQGIDTSLVGTLPPERKANYLLDQTQALVQVGRYSDAVRTLGEAEHVAAEEVRCRPLAHGLLRSLLDTTSGESGLTGHPVRTTYRTSEDGSMPRADAIVVAPATYNTINKWAAGIADNYVLNQLAELTGLGARIVVLPFVNQGLAANQVFIRSVEKLRQAGVHVLFGPGEFEPHPPRTGSAVLDSFPWDRALTVAQK